MSALDHNPTNKNYLSPLTFLFNIKRAPNVNFFIQRAHIPGLTLDAVEQNNPFVTIPRPGDHIDFEDLAIEFKVSENLDNWLEIFNWIKNTGFPNSYEEYANIASKSIISGEGITSDITLLLANNNKILNIDVTFKDALPISLTSLEFDSTNPNIEYLSAVATFKYRTYDITIL